jgi:hypothetical protein
MHDQIRLFFGRAITSEEAVLHARLVDRLGESQTDPGSLRSALASMAPRQSWSRACATRSARRLRVDSGKAKENRHSVADCDYDYLPKEADLRTVQSALRHSAHILGNPRELPGQRIGHFLEI